MKSISRPLAAALLASSLLAPAAAFAQVTPNGQPQAPIQHPTKSPNDQPATNPPTTPGSVMAHETNDAGQATTARKYVQMMAESDLFEVQSSRLALTKSDNAGIRTFANRMIADHTKSTAALKQIVASNKIGVTVPSVLVAPQKDMLDKLRSLSGTPFDHAYLDDQVQGHQQALQLQQTYSARGDNAALKAFATKLTPTIQDHLNMATKLTEGNIDPQAKPQTKQP